MPNPLLKQISHEPLACRVRKRKSIAVWETCRYQVNIWRSFNLITTPSQLAAYPYHSPVISKYRESAKICLKPFTLGTYLFLVIAVISYISDGYKNCIYLV